MKFNKQADISRFEEELVSVIKHEEFKKSEIDLYVAYCKKWIYCSKCQGTGKTSIKQMIFFRKEETCSDCGGYGINENGFNNISIPSFDIWNQTTIKERKQAKVKVIQKPKKEEQTKKKQETIEKKKPKEKKLVSKKEKGE